MQSDSVITAGMQPTVNFSACKSWLWWNPPWPLLILPTILYVLNTVLTLTDVMNNAGYIRGRGCD